MHQKGVLWSAAAVAAVVALAIACGGNSRSPASPTSAGVPTEVDVAADGSTLKVSAPVLSSPVGGVRLTGDSDTVTLVFQAAAGKFVSGQPYTYQVQLMNAAGALLEEKTGGTGLSYAMSTRLDVDTTYRWRVRANFSGAVGPWSATETFRSVEERKGYLRGNELYDPLTKGTTIGTIVGPVTFIPGVGVRLEDFGSRIVYELQEPLEDGELSALVTNVATNTEGGKTKIFSMAQGYGDLTTNERRMTVEKRGDSPTGAVAWRFLTSGGDGVDTIGAERVVREFDPGQTYFWEADWRDGVFRLRINRGGVSGPNIYDFGKRYEGFYRPEPHVVYLGGGPARGGLDSQTVPGMVIRQVWVSYNPRPVWANK
jgi:hypothetical protein